MKIAKTDIPRHIKMSILTQRNRASWLVAAGQLLPPFSTVHGSISFAIPGVGFASLPPAIRRLSCLVRWESSRGLLMIRHRVWRSETGRSLSPMNQAWV